MGTLRYGSSDGPVFVLADDVLAHVSAVVTAKLRRREPFLLTCMSDGTREAIWIHEASTLVYSYDEAAEAQLDRARLEAMVQATNRPSGLTIEAAARSGLHSVDDLTSVA